MYSCNRITELLTWLLGMSARGHGMGHVCFEGNLALNAEEKTTVAEGLSVGEGQAQQVYPLIY